MKRKHKVVRHMRNPLQALQDLIDQGLQPYRRMIWLGLGFLPQKLNAIAIDPAMLPTAAQCRAVRGLDVVLLIKGFSTRYGSVKRLCELLNQAQPRRLQLYDLDFKKVAYLKFGGEL